MEQPSLLEGVSLFLAVLGEGQSIAEMLFGGGPDFQSIINNLETEIKAMFLEDLADQSVYTAAGVAQAARDWLATDYVNAQNNGETKEQLWAMLTQDTSGPRVADLVAQATTMLGWANDNPKAIAQKTTSLALTIYGLIVALHRERAANAPDPQTAAAENADMRDYAQKAVDRIGPLATSVSQSRITSISAITGGIDGADMPIYYVSDTWLADPEGNPMAILSVWRGNEFNYPTPDYLTQITAAYAAYLALLQTGTDDAASAFTQSIGNAFRGIGPSDFPPAPDAQAIIAQVPAFQTTGQWIASAPGALDSLLKIAIHL